MDHVQKHQRGRSNHALFPSVTWAEFPIGLQPCHWQSFQSAMTTPSISDQWVPLWDTLTIAPVVRNTHWSARSTSSLSNTIWGSNWKIWTRSSTPSIPLSTPSTYLSTSVNLFVSLYQPRPPACQSRQPACQPLSTPSTGLSTAVNPINLCRFSVLGLEGFAISGLLNRYQVIVFHLDIHSCIYIPPASSRLVCVTFWCDIAQLGRNTIAPSVPQPQIVL